MEFFIKQNATLPLLKLQVVKDGRSDYDNFMKSIESSEIFFSMVDTENGIPKILSIPAGFVVKEFTDSNPEPEYYIYYQFKNRDTNNVGRFEGQFTLNTYDGVLILPIREKLFINVQESFIANDLEYNSNYIIEFPCCDNPIPTPTPAPTRPCVQFITDELGNYIITENGNFLISDINPCITPTPTQTPTQTSTPTQTPTPTSTPSPLSVILDADITPGSIIINYNLISNHSFGEEISINFTHSLGTTGSPIIISTGVTISVGDISGTTQIILPNDFNDLTRDDSFGNIVPYPLFLQWEITENYPTPTPTPTITETVTPTPTITETVTPTPTITVTPTLTPTPSATPILCNNFTFTGSNVTTTINSVIKTSGGGWNSSAYSLESYTSPVSVTFQVSNSNSYLMGGFSYNPNANPTNTYVDISYGLYIQPNFLEIYENGNQVTVPGSMTNTTSDVWKVDYNGINVKYYKNDILIYTSSNSVTQPLHIYYPILTAGDGVINVCVITGPSPSMTPTPTTTQTITPTPTKTPYCIRQIVVPTLWNGGTSVNTNQLKLTQTSETLQIQVNDIITDNIGATSFVGIVSSDGTYTYVNTGHGGGVAFSCQFPLTFSGAC